MQAKQFSICFGQYNKKIAEIVLMTMLLSNWSMYEYFILS